MKRHGILNRHLSNLVASIGHLDKIIVADAGLPIPNGVETIDLAISQGVPSFWDVIQALQTELTIEAAWYAEEASEEVIAKMTDVIATWEQDNDIPVRLETLSHEMLKEQARNAKAVIRTGECTPYCNLVLVSGVTF